MTEEPRLWSNRDFARLFAAQVTSLVGSGVTSIALAALAFQLAGAQATTIIGFALTLRILATANDAARAAHRNPARIVSVSQCHSAVRRNSCAFNATMIVDIDISPAAIAGVSVSPHGAKTPAASGIAITL